MTPGTGGALVAATSLCTSLGYTTPAVDAAMRGGIVMFSDTPWLSRRGVPMRAASIDRLSWDLPRSRRMQIMTAIALDKVWPFTGERGRAAPQVFLAVPEPGFAEPVLDVLQRLLPDVRSTVQVFGQQGRGASFFALAAALAAIEAGMVSSALVGGVDSLCTHETLVELDRRERLLGATHTGGLMPGEGAAFLLLTDSPTHPYALQAPSQGVVLAASTASERHHFLQSEPNRADALTAVFSHLQHHPACGARRADVFHTCETGEPFWAEEMVMAALRTHALMPEPFTRRMAADAFGDLDAASGAVMLTVGLQTLGRQVERRGLSLLLVAGSGDEGHVGACLAQGVGLTV